MKSPQPIRWWEPFGVFAITFAVFALLAPRMTTYLSPSTGDEPFYLMTAISIRDDHDINECNNYRQRDEAQIYPQAYLHALETGFLPAGWKGWNGAPYPLPPHPALIVPETRQCAGLKIGTNSTVDITVPVPNDGTHNELYSKHGLGLSLLVLPAFVLDGRLAVVLFLNFLGALLAANIYLLAREGTGRVMPAILTWLAFAFTVPVAAYSFLIFPELPAALLVIYAFRRIRLWSNSNWLQMAGVGASLAFLPWLHYRFAPVVVALLAYFLYKDFSERRTHTRGWRVQNYIIVMLQVAVSAVLLMAFFYQHYAQIYPNASDHAGINDVAGTIRGAVGLLVDEQWGLFVAAPVFILAIVGIVLMFERRAWRRDLLWIGIVFVPYFGVIANYAQWWGEWCPPARYLTSVLPLLALPFAIGLYRIRSAAYTTFYGILAAVSFLVTWGFMYQPHWMFNQPALQPTQIARSELLKNGLPLLLEQLPFSVPVSSITNGVMARLPNFVKPYFVYYSYGKTAGDVASSDAWRASAGPLLFVAFIVMSSLTFAWWSGRPTEGTSQRRPGPQPVDSESRHEEMPVAGADAQEAVPLSTLEPVGPAQSSSVSAREQSENPL